MILKEGVDFDVEGPMLLVEAFIDPLTQRLFGREAVCTSGRRTKTSGGSSLHPHGLAMDLRTIDQTPEKQREYADEVAKLLGSINPFYQVILEGPASLDDRYRNRVAHLHIEYDDGTFTQ